MNNFNMHLFNQNSSHMMSDRMLYSLTLNKPFMSLLKSKHHKKTIICINHT